LIRLHNVHKAFGQNQVLVGLDLHVKEGESLVLMGPSGAGKSVILKHIIGLLKPDAGEVLVEGKIIHELSSNDLRNLRKDMGYLFQHAALINWLDVFDNVALPLRESRTLPEAEVKIKVEEVLTRVRMQDALKKFPAELSGGMQKRVGLARALVTNPRIILYDEPEAGLDPEMSYSVSHMIRRLREELHTTSITVTHSWSCAEMVGDKVALFENGSLVTQGSPKTLLENPHPRFRKFLGPQHHG
jgi:phospholipid/cholesterol/gamma-HCH transport system ATP-binding protein